MKVALRSCFIIAFATFLEMGNAQTVSSALIMYTDDARAGAGSTTAIQNEIIASVNQGNLALANSGTGMTIQIADMREISVDETKYGTLSALNNDLSNPASATFKIVHDIRNQVSADLVFLVVEGIEANGLAFQVCGSGLTCDNTFEKYAFASGQRSLVVSFPLMIPHEFGHVMGLRHDRTRDCGSEATTCATGAFPYSYGHIDPIAPVEWGTVMAGGRPFGLVNYFSTPNRTHPTTGQPLGIANVSDASRSLTNVGWIVADWRVPLINQTIITPLLLEN
ncbi:MAG: peptidyl-Asp metalloendopeptidase [Fibrobacteres bacterium]|nr:peptidyl-Asp metalloendopeptidase [Fibrobacterota bacterium]